MSHYLVTSASGATHRYPADQVQTFILNLHGGGFTNRQTQDAQDAFNRLNEHGEIEIGRWQIRKGEYQ